MKLTYCRFVDEIQHCRACGVQRVELWGVLEVLQDDQGTRVEGIVEMLCKGCVIERGGDPAYPKHYGGPRGEP